MTSNTEKPIILSGIQPSGHLNIGNYLGAIKNWVDLQNEYHCIFMLADLHTITVKQDPAELRKRCYDFLAQYIACGINPESNVLFAQSHVAEHSQLAWVLNCYTCMGELNRMTQFKDKSKRHDKNINAGLFTYPSLMAADILLYNTALVPVGADQKQHLELTRDLAQRFNAQYGDIFRVPEPFIPKCAGRIMGLQNPECKMSKSDSNENNTITLLDSPKVIDKKIKRCVTDSGSEIKYHETKAGISNLLTLYSAITGLSIDSLEKQYEGQGYGTFKADVSKAIITTLTPIQDRFQKIRSDEDYLREILRKGAESASARASKMLDRVYDAIGLIPR